jgi:hypothetical protein
VVLPQASTPGACVRLSDVSDSFQSDDPWASDLPEGTRGLLARLVSHGMPLLALETYARWWQLESWLRELAYVELRARDGVAWAENAKVARGRLASDASFTHMAGPDRENPLAYLDYSQLLDVIDDNWSLFTRTLVVQSSWAGRQDDLQRIRHRVAHLRWPADDDRERIEQTLRDLERGAFIALATYNRRFSPGGEELNHPVADGWIGRNHPDAKRLITHAADAYDVRFKLTRSLRPWAEPGATTTAGKLWHADLWSGRAPVDVGAIWRDVRDTKAGRLLVAIESNFDNHVGFTFAAVDDGGSVADAIGALFESFMVVGRSGSLHSSRAASVRRWSSFDYRIWINTGWNIVESDTLPISVFGAGGGTQYAPEL